MSVLVSSISSPVIGARRRSRPLRGRRPSGFRERARLGDAPDVLRRLGGPVQPGLLAGCPDRPVTVATMLRRRP